MGNTFGMSSPRGGAIGNTLMRNTFMASSFNLFSDTPSTLPHRVGLWGDCEPLVVFVGFFGLIVRLSGLHCLSTGLPVGLEEGHDHPCTLSPLKPSPMVNRMPFRIWTVRS